MINQQLLDFIKQQLLKGVDKETIKKELLEGGWAQVDIDEGFNIVNTPIVNTVINPVASNSLNTKIPIIKKSHKKKIIVSIVVLFCVYLFLKLMFLMDTPFLETCIQSEVFGYDKATGNSIKYVECMKGYKEDYGMGDSSRIISQRTSGYVTFNKNGDVISTIPLQKNSDNSFKNGIYPDFYFKDRNLFVAVTAGSDSSEGKMSDIKNEILIFGNGNINKIRDVFFEWRYILKYENNEIYYLNFENQKIIKEDLLTGKSSIVIDSNSIKKDDLNYPIKIKFSKIEGKASTYNLQYDPNPKMEMYKLLLLLKGGTFAETRSTSLN